MKIIVMVVIIALASAVLFVSDADESGYVPFPSGFGYMENTHELQLATNSGHKSYIRDHAWKMWAGIMQPDKKTGWPLWYSWENTTSAFAKAQTEASLTPAKPFIPNSLRKHNNKNTPNVNTKAPIYCIPEQVQLSYPNAITRDSTGQLSIGDGSNFQNNGDIMIATESLSKEAYNSIRNQKLYLQSTLDQKYKNNKDVNIAQRSIVTKHMYWPVKASGLTALPVWKNQIKPNNPDYAGYEKWDSLVAIDPSGIKAGENAQVSFLYQVREYQADWQCPTNNHYPKGSPAIIPAVTKNAQIYDINDFYFHKVTKDDWTKFNDQDKAIINASSYWANNTKFEVGDYLVTVAMHVNTKELPSWTLQSVWWTDVQELNNSKNPYGKNRPVLPNAQGPWQHYLMTDSYAVPPNDEGKLDIAFNPYIEGVTHPVASSCRNCHVRAGWPTAVDHRKGTASYQNPDCPDLLADITHETQCLKSLTHTDYLWIVPDRAIDH
jgi:hypothetical protein